MTEHGPHDQNNANKLVDFITNVHVIHADTRN